MKNKINWEKEIINIRNLVEQGKTFTEIGEYYKISGHQIGMIAKKYGITKPDPRIQDKANLEKLLFEEKLSIQETADIYKCTYQNISYKINQYGIDFVPEEKATWKMLSKDVLIDRLTKGDSPKDISEEFSLTINIVRNAIRNYNIDFGQIKKNNKREKLLDDIARLVKKGATNNRISKTLGISYYLVNECIKELGISPNKKNFNHYEESDLRKYLLEEKLSFSEISVKYYNGVDPSSISHAAKRFGIDVDILDRDNISHGERIVMQFLKENNIDFEFQCKIANDIKGRNLDLVIIDFQFEYNENVYWIEYNGQQHYRYSKLFHNGNEEEFKKQVIRDRNVRNYCKNNNIILIEIPYTVDFIKIPEILSRIVFQGVDSSTLIDYKNLYK